MQIGQYVQSDNRLTIGDLHFLQMATVSMRICDTLDFLSLRIYIASVYINLLHDWIKNFIFYASLPLMKIANSIFAISNKDGDK